MLMLMLMLMPMLQSCENPAGRTADISRYCNISLSFCPWMPVFKDFFVFAVLFFYSMIE